MCLMISAKLISLQCSLTMTYNYVQAYFSYQVLQNCPKDLQSDICIHLNRKIIDGTPAFAELSNAVLRAVARNFAIHRVAPGERVVHEGESLDALYFIGSGSFEVTQKGKVVGLLGKRSKLSDLKSVFQ